MMDRHSGVLPGGATASAELILVRVGSQELAIDVMSVREIRGWSEPTPMFQAPPCISGVISLRGTPLPIIDLAVRLGMSGMEPPAAPPCATSVIIVVQGQARQFGLVVDSVSELLRVASSEIQPNPNPAEAGAFVTGLVARGERILSVISPETLFPEVARTVDPDWAGRPAGTA